MKNVSNLKPLFKLVTVNGKSFVRKYYVKEKDIENIREKNRFDTKDCHTDSFGEYKKERKQLHQRIISEAVSNCPLPRDGQKPKVILLMGGAASGKSTVVKNIIEPEYGSSNFGTLNADDVKEQLPEYESFVREDVETAANRVHEESSDISKAILSQVVYSGRNFIYDAVLGNSEKANKLINDLHDRGYEIELMGVSIDTKIAWDRAFKRALGSDGEEDGSGRFVPSEPFFKGHKGTVDTFNNFDRAKVTKYSLYDNNVAFGEKPVLIENEHGVVNSELKQVFLNKKNVTEQEVLQKAYIELDELINHFGVIKKAFDQLQTTTEIFLGAKNAMSDIFKSMNPYEAVSFKGSDYSLNINELMDIVADNTDFQHYADAIVFGPEGLLIIQRTNFDNFGAGKWCLPGGKVEQGEFIREAVKRELFEETGLVANGCNYSTLYRNGDGSFTHYLYCNVEDVAIPMIDADEIQQFVWVDPDDLDMYDFLLDCKERIKSILGVPFKAKELTEQELAAVADNKIEKADDIIPLSGEQTISKGKFLELYDKYIVKAKKSYQIGETSQTTGMKKVAPGKWVDPKTGKPTKKEDDAKGGNLSQPESKVVDISKYSDKDLVEYAKNSSEADLQAVIKESGLERLRKVAHDELERRTKEEAPQDKKDGAAKNPESKKTVM